MEINREVGELYDTDRVSYRATYPLKALIFMKVQFNNWGMIWLIEEADGRQATPATVIEAAARLFGTGSVSVAVFTLPGPRDSLIHCYIKRNRSTQTYYLSLCLNQASNDDGKFLLAARKFRHATYIDYIITLNSKDFSKGSSFYIGKLRSNFLGSKFTVYDAQPPKAGAKVTKCGSTKLVCAKQVSPKIPPGNYPVAHISYELNVLGSRGPRKMSCVMDTIPASAFMPGGVAPIQTEFVSINSMDSFPSLTFFRSKSTRTEHVKSDILSPQQISRTLVMKNKAPRWHEQLQCWCLNFNGRVTVASVKNFQLVVRGEGGTEGGGASVEENENVIIQFGKVGKDVFTMDYQYPISAFQAFAISLSSFNTKIPCE